jgi:hypothetical protein
MAVLAGLGKESLNWQSRQGLIRQTPRQFHGLGNLARFQLPPRHRFDTVGAGLLLEGIDFGGLIADKGFDSDRIVANLNERGAKAVISQHPRGPSLCRSIANKWRHLNENFFKRIAMRAEKTDQSFSAMIHLAAAVINSR